MPRCGASSVEITPARNLPMAGYSSAGQKARGQSNPLFARTLYLQDDEGAKVAFCFIDLMSGSRALLDRAIAMTAGRFATSEVILAGTHTHTGPGLFYGNTFYDAFASSQLFATFDEALATDLATKIATSLTAAQDRAVPALLGVGEKTLFGFSRNRSLVAFRENRESVEWHRIHPPGGAFPPEFLAVDPRVTTIAAITQDTRKLIASCALFPCHTTALGKDWDRYDPDWPGVARTTAEDLLKRDGLGDTLMVAFGNSACGDISPTRGDRPQGRELATFVGTSVGTAIADSTRRAVANAASFSLRTRFVDMPRPGDEWVIGAATLAGGVDGRSTFWPDAAHDGMVSERFTPENPHFPKSEGLGDVQRMLRELLKLEQAERLPLHACNVSGNIFVTVPGEATVTLGHRIESAVKAATRATRVRVIAYAGDYSGYYTTHEEYMMQCYEGSSMIYGRFASERLAHEIEALARGVS
jgi:neutral ceramidase